MAYEKNQWPRYPDVGGFIGGFDPLNIYIYIYFGPSPETSGNTDILYNIWKHQMFRSNRAPTKTTIGSNIVHQHRLMLGHSCGRCWWGEPNHQEARFAGDLGKVRIDPKNSNHMNKHWWIDSSCILLPCLVIPSPFDNKIYLNISNTRNKTQVWY